MDKKHFHSLNKTLFNTSNNSDLDLEQRKSMYSDSSFINKKMLKSMKSTQAKIPSKLDTTCSQQWPNSKPKN